MGGWGTGGETTTNQTSTPAPWVEDASRRGVGYAESLFNQPYQAYGGQRVAGLSQNEYAALSQAGEDRYSPWLRRSGQALQRAGNISNRSAAGRIQGYMNPYQRQVLDVANESMARDYQQRQNQLRSQAASRGAFGGGRQTMLETQGTQDFLKAQGDLYSTGMAAAYDRALAAAQSDMQRAQQGAFAQAAGYGNLAGQAAGLSNDQIRALMATGEMERSTRQGQLDADYEAYLREQGMQREDLDRFLASLRAGDYTRTGVSDSDRNRSGIEYIF